MEKRSACLLKAIKIQINVIKATPLELCFWMVNWSHCLYSGIINNTTCNSREGIKLFAKAHSSTPISDLASLPRNLHTYQSYECISIYVHIHRKSIKKVYLLKNLSARIILKEEHNLDSKLMKIPSVNAPDPTFSFSPYFFVLGSYTEIISPSNTSVTAATWVWFTCLPSTYKKK